MIVVIDYNVGNVRSVCNAFREQVADIANTLAWKIWQKYPYSWEQIKKQCRYYQERNEASYASRRKTAKAKSIELL